jgi:hypothetical protein
MKMAIAAFDCNGMDLMEWGIPIMLVTTDNVGSD